MLALHHIVAAINSFRFITFGADLAALTFHRNGVELAQSGEWTFGIGGGG